MSAPDPAALWDRLRDAGCVDGDRPVAAAIESPWFVSAMLGVAGWIGAAFLLAFVGLGLKLDDGSSCLFMGTIALGGGGALLARRAHGDFAGQFGFAISLAGQGLILFGLFDLSGHGTKSTPALIMGLVQTGLFFAVPSFVHRVWTAWSGAVAYSWLLLDAHLTAFGPALLALACAPVWLAEFRSARRAAMVRAAGYGLSLALVTWITLETWALGHGLPAPWTRVPPAERLAAGALGGATLLWVCHAITSAPRAPGAPKRWIVLAPAAIVAIASLRAPGLAPAILLVVIGFAHAHRPLLGLGVAAVLGYLSAYYYSLEATLLVKSAGLAATGAALLAARTVLFRRWPASATAESGDA